MSTLSPPFAESVVGPCADVPVPASARPALLIRNSVHAAVRDVQRRLNDFHGREFMAGRPGLDDAPLLEDCVFGQHTFNALLSFQRIAFPGDPREHDGRVGPHTWAALDRAATGPPIVPPSPPPPVPVPPPFRPPAPPSPPIGGIAFRPCCMLEPGSLTDAASLGGHGGMGGILYTGKAGFVDIGHVRDVSDLTGQVYQQIHAAGGATGTRINTTEGEARLTSSVAPIEWLEVAESIAFDDALGHEIMSYDIGRCGAFFNVAGMHNSAFSPEDLCSNRLGTVVAARALTTGGTWGVEVERQIQALLTSLDAQTIAETRVAFGLIHRRWVDTRIGFSGNCYLRRRNFTFAPFKAGHSSDSATPAFVTAPFAFSATYDYTHAVRLTRSFTKAGFPAEFTRIRADARTLYGPSFDSP